MRCVNMCFSGTLLHRLRYKQRKKNNTLKVRTILYHNKNYSFKIILRTSQRNQSKQRRVILKK